MQADLLDPKIEFDELSNKVIGCAIEVHRALGPGLLESTYEKCLSHELESQNISHEVQVALPINYKDVNLDCGYRIDLLVENLLIIELKSVKSFDAVHKAQILTYMKLSKIRTGLLLNFNVPKLKDGIQRFVI